MSLIELCPSAPHRAALRLTGVAVGAPVSERLLRDLEQTDPVALAGIANVNFVHTLLSAAQGQNSQLDAALPEDLWLYFREMERANIQRLEKSHDLLQRISATFAAEGLTGVLMKGGVQMLEPAGFNVKHRFMSDLDILLPKAEAHHAHACLVALGGTFDPDKEKLWLPFHHHLPQLYFEDLDTVIEIHVAVGAPSIARVLTAESYIARAQPSSLSGLFLPHPEDRYLHHILHSALKRHDIHHIFLRSILDHVAFQKITTPEDQSAARVRLDLAGLGAELRILSALTDLALGQEDSSVIVSETKWLKTALPLFGQPGRRQFKMVARTVARALFNLIASAPHRRRTLGMLRKEGLRKRLLAHRDALKKQR